MRDGSRTLHSTKTPLAANMKENSRTSAGTTGEKKDRGSVNGKLLISCLLIRSFQPEPSEILQFLIAH